MKTTDDKLDRLLRAAAKAPPREAGDIPLGLETRAIAQWRAGGFEDESAFLFTFLRRAALCAAVALLLSAVWTFTRPPSDNWGDGLSVANFELQAGLSP